MSKNEQQKGGWGRGVWCCVGAAVSRLFCVLCSITNRRDVLVPSHILAKTIATCSCTMYHHNKRH